jgi:hypothetical protein
MIFSVFDFKPTKDKLEIQCRRCPAPAIDYFAEPDQKFYRAKGWPNPENSELTDIAVSCYTCGNSEAVKGVEYKFEGK